MISSKKFVASLNSKEYLVGVVEAQLEDELIRPWGKVSVRKEFEFGVTSANLTSSEPSCFIDNCTTYSWDFNSASSTRVFKFQLWILWSISRNNNHSLSATLAARFLAPCELKPISSLTL